MNNLELEELKYEWISELYDTIAMLAMHQPDLESIASKLGRMEASIVEGVVYES